MEVFNSEKGSLELRKKCNHNSCAWSLVIACLILTFSLIFTVLVLSDIMFGEKFNLPSRSNWITDLEKEWHGKLHNSNNNDKTNFDKVNKIIKSIRPVYFSDVEDEFGYPADSLSLEIDKASNKNGVTLTVSVLFEKLYTWMTTPLGQYVDFYYYENKGNNNMSVLDSEEIFQLICKVTNPGRKNAAANEINLIYDTVSQTLVELILEHHSNSTVLSEDNNDIHHADGSVDNRDRDTTDLYTNCVSRQYEDETTGQNVTEYNLPCEFHCDEIEANATGYIIWTIDGVPLPSSNGTAVLRLRDIDITSKGKIKCELYTHQEFFITIKEFDIAIDNQLFIDPSDDTLFTPESMYTHMDFQDMCDRSVAINTHKVFSVPESYKKNMEKEQIHWVINGVSVGQDLFNTFRIGLKSSTSHDDSTVIVPGMYTCFLAYPTGESVLWATIYVRNILPDRTLSADSTDRLDIDPRDLPPFVADNFLDTKQTPAHTGVFWKSATFSPQDFSLRPQLKVVYLDDRIFFREDYLVDYTISNDQNRVDVGYKEGKTGYYIITSESEIHSHKSKRYIIRIKKKKLNQDEEQKNNMSTPENKIEVQTSDSNSILTAAASVSHERSYQQSEFFEVFILENALQKTTIRLFCPDVKFISTNSYLWYYIRGGSELPIPDNNNNNNNNNESVTLKQTGEYGRGSVLELTGSASHLGGTYLCHSPINGSKKRSFTVKVATSHIESLYLKNNQDVETINFNYNARKVRRCTRNPRSIFHRRLRILPGMKPEVLYAVSENIRCTYDDDECFLCRNLYEQDLYFLHVYRVTHSLDLLSYNVPENDIDTIYSPYKNLFLVNRHRPFYQRHEYFPKIVGSFSGSVMSDLVGWNVTNVQQDFTNIFSIHKTQKSRNRFDRLGVIRRTEAFSHEELRYILPILVVKYVNSPRITFVSFEDIKRVDNDNRATTREQLSRMNPILLEGDDLVVRLSYHHSYFDDTFLDENDNKGEHSKPCKVMLSSSSASVFSTALERINSRPSHYENNLNDSGPNYILTKMNQTTVTYLKRIAIILSRCIRRTVIQIVPIILQDLLGNLPIPVRLVIEYYYVSGTTPETLEFPEEVQINRELTALRDRIQSMSTTNPVPPKHICKRVSEEMGIYIKLTTVSILVSQFQFLKNQNLEDEITSIRLILPHRDQISPLSLQDTLDKLTLKKTYSHDIRKASATTIEEIITRECDARNDTSRKSTFRWLMSLETNLTQHLLIRARGIYQRKSSSDDDDNMIFLFDERKNLDTFIKKMTHEMFPPDRMTTTSIPSLPSMAKSLSARLFEYFNINEPFTEYGIWFNTMIMTRDVLGYYNVTTIFASNDGYIIGEFIKNQTLFYNNTTLLAQAYATRNKQLVNEQHSLSSIRAATNDDDDSLLDELVKLASGVVDSSETLRKEITNLYSHLENSDSDTFLSPYDKRGGSALANMRDLRRLYDIYSSAIITGALNHYIAAATDVAKMLNAYGSLSLMERDARYVRFDHSSTLSVNFTSLSIDVVNKVILAGGGGGGGLTTNLQRSTYLTVCRLSCFYSYRCDDYTIFRYLYNSIVTKPGDIDDLQIRVLNAFARSNTLLTRRPFHDIFSSVTKTFTNRGYRLADLMSTLADLRVIKRAMMPDDGKPPPVVEYIPKQAPKICKNLFSMTQVINYKTLLQNDTQASTIRRAERASTLLAVGIMKMENSILQAFGIARADDNDPTTATVVCSNLDLTEALCDGTILDSVRYWSLVHGAGITSVYALSRVFLLDFPTTSDLAKAKLVRRYYSRNRRSKHVSYTLSLSDDRKDVRIGTFGRKSARRRRSRLMGECANMSGGYSYIGSGEYKIPCFYHSTEDLEVFVYPSGRTSYELLSGVIGMMREFEHEQIFGIPTSIHVPAERMISVSDLGSNRRNPRIWCSNSSSESGGNARRRASGKKNVRYLANFDRYCAKKKELSTVRQQSLGLSSEKRPSGSRSLAFTIASGRFFSVVVSSQHYHLGKMTTIQDYNGIKPRAEINHQTFMQALLKKRAWEHSLEIIIGDIHNVLGAISDIGTQEEKIGYIKTYISNLNPSTLLEFWRVFGSESKIMYANMKRRSYLNRGVGIDTVHLNLTYSKRQIAKKLEVMRVVGTDNSRHNTLLLLPPPPPSPVSTSPAADPLSSFITTKTSLRTSGIIISPAVEGAIVYYASYRYDDLVRNTVNFTDLLDSEALLYYMVVGDDGIEDEKGYVLNNLKLYEYFKFENPRYLLTDIRSRRKQIDKSSNVCSNDVYNTACEMLGWTKAADYLSLACDSYNLRGGTWGHHCDVYECAIINLFRRVLLIN